MRGLAWGALAVSLFAGAIALDGFLAPVPPRSDLATFASAAVAILFAFLAVVLATRPRAWVWWFVAAWIGSAIAVSFLAYKDNGLEELRALGPMTILWHLALHALIAPIALFFGFTVGFMDPRAPLYVLASLGIALLGAELIRRRVWPREREGESPNARASDGPR